MKAFLSGLIVLVSLSTNAAELIIPDTFEVLQVDGEKQSKSYFTKSTTLDLEPGQHVIEIQYSEMFDHDSEDYHETVRSQPFVLIFDATTEDIKLTHAEQLGIDEARQFAESPQVELVTEVGNPIKVQQLTQKQYQQYLLSIEQQRRQQVVKQSLSDDPSEFSEQGPDAVEMLEYWWEQATDAERQEFIRYLREEQK